MTLRRSPPRSLPASRRRGAPWARTFLLLGLAAVLLAVYGCAGGEPEGPTPEQKAAEEAAKAAPEPPPPPPPPPPEPGMSPDEAEAIMKPEEKPPVTEESIPEFRYLEGREGKGEQGPPDQLAMVEPGAASATGPVRIAVLHGPGQDQAAIGVATVIDTYQNEKLSKAVGRPLKVAYLSRVSRSPRPDNLVRYREGMLKAALQLATVLPGDQTVEPMTPEDAAQTPVDVVIYLGSNVR